MSTLEPAGWLTRSLARTARMFGRGVDTPAPHAAAADPPCPFVDTQATWRDMPAETSVGSRSPHGF